MSDAGIIEVSFDDFWGRKARTLDIDPKTAARVGQVLSSYDCFTKEIMFYAPPSMIPTKTQGKHGGGRSNGNNNRNNTGVRYMHYAHSENPALKKQRTPIMEVRGFLNKITTMTYNDLLQKIIRCCAYKECSQAVIQAILHKCYIHGTYAHLYHGLLSEMFKRYETDTLIAINAFVFDFIDQLPSELAKIEFQPNSTCDYEGYCAYVKCKTVIHNKLECILTILKAYYSQTDIRTIQDRVFHILAQRVNTVSRRGNEIYYDFIDTLSSLICLLKREKAISSKNEDELAFIYNDIKTAFVDLPKKIAFCWEYILSL